MYIEKSGGECEYREIAEMLGMINKGESSRVVVE
jgi:hypothetical protein